MEEFLMVEKVGPVLDINAMLEQAKHWRHIAGLMFNEFGRKQCLRQAQYWQDLADNSPQ